MAQDQERAAFEAALSTKPEARFWNTSDAMFLAYQWGRAAVPEALPAATWRPFGLTLEYALNRGENPALLMDENSPLRDELRRLLASVPSAPSDEQIESVLRLPVADGEDVAFYLLHGCKGVSPEVEAIMVREVARTMLSGAAPVAAPAAEAQTQEPTGKFGHHPDPAIDFTCEVDAIEGEITDRAAGLPATMDLGARIERAMQFTVGGDTKAIAAKHDLRKIEAAFKSGAASPAPQPMVMLTQPEVQSAHYAEYGTRADGAAFRFAYELQCAFAAKNGAAVAPKENNNG
jgi:hypothetical protein